MAGRPKKEVTHFPWGCSKEITAVPILIKSKYCGWNCFSLPPAKPRTDLCDSLDDDTHLLKFDSICPLGLPWSFIITTDFLSRSINIIMVYFIMVVITRDSFMLHTKCCLNSFQLQCKSLRKHAHNAWMSKFRCIRLRVTSSIRHIFKVCTTWLFGIVLLHNSYTCTSKFQLQTKY